MEINLTEQMILALDRVMRLLRRRPHGSQLGRGAYRLLTLIHEQGELSTRELAELLDVRPSSLNETLSRLEQDGFVSRTRSAHDQRVFLVKLLPGGEVKLAAERGERISFDELRSGILTDDEATELTRLAQKLADGLEHFVATEKRGHHHHLHEHHRDGKGGAEWI